MFYFWNVNELVKDLRAGIVTEYEKMRYLLATSLLQLYAFYFTVQFTPTNKFELLIKALSFGIEVGVIVWGLYHCYIINKHNDNKDFLDRFICLGLPICIRLFVYLIAGALIGFLLIALSIALFSGFSENVSAASEVTINLIPNLKAQITIALQNKDLLRRHILKLIVSVIISILFFIILGRKIDAVGKK